MSNKQWNWWAAEGDLPDIFTIAAASRDQVIAQARAEFGSRQTFTIVEATKNCSFETDIFSADDENLNDIILERFTDLNGGSFGEDGVEDFPQVDADLCAALNAAFTVWLAPHEAGIPTFTFTAQRNLEVIFPPRLEVVSDPP